MNTKGTVGNVSEDFTELMHFLDTSEIREYNNQLVNEMASELEKARSNAEWRKDYMSLELLKFDCREEGREEGRAEDILKMLKKGLDIVFISDCLEVPQNTVAAIAASM